MDTPEQSPAPAASEELSLPARLWGTIMEPTKVFEALRERPKWLLVFVVALLIQGAVAWILFPIQMDEQADLMADSEFFQRFVPEAQREQMVEEMRNPAAWRRHAAPVQLIVVSFIMLFVYAGLMHLGQRILGGQGRFRAVLAVGAHSSFIAALGALVGMPLRLARKSVLEVTLSPAIFLEADITSKAYRLLASLDVFWIWATVVAGLGLAVVSRISKGAGLAVSVLLYLVLAGIGFGLSSLFL